MKRKVILLIFPKISLLHYGQIIAHYEVVDKYTDIPKYYFDLFKQMWLVYAGESHSGAIRAGLLNLEVADPTYAVCSAKAGTP